MKLVLASFWGPKSHFSQSGSPVKLTQSCLNHGKVLQSCLNPVEFLWYYDYFSLIYSINKLRILSVCMYTCTYTNTKRILNYVFTMWWKSLFVFTTQDLNIQHFDCYRAIVISYRNSINLTDCSQHQTMAFLETILLYLTPLSRCLLHIGCFASSPAIGLLPHLRDQ